METATPTAPTVTLSGELHKFGQNQGNGPATFFLEACMNGDGEPVAGLATLYYQRSEFGREELLRLTNHNIRLAIFELSILRRGAYPRIVGFRIERKPETICVAFECHALAEALVKLGWFEEAELLSTTA